MLLDKVVALSLGLIDGDRHILVELVLLALDHVLDCATHLLDQEHVQFRVESILVVLVQALD